MSESSSFPVFGAELSVDIQGLEMQDTLDTNLFNQISVLMTKWVTWLPVVPCKVWSLIRFSRLTCLPVYVDVNFKVVNTHSTGWCIVIHTTLYQF